MGRRRRGRRLRAAPPPAAPRRVPAHRSARRAIGCAEFVEDFAPHVVAHFGVYEPASRMTPASARSNAPSCARWRPCSAAARDRRARVRRPAQRPRGVRPADCACFGARRRRRARAAHAVRSFAARGRGDRRRDCALRARRSGGRAAVRAGRRARTFRARSDACCGSRSCPCRRSPTRRSRCCIPTTRPRRWSWRSNVGSTGRCNIVGPGAATPWQAARLGGRVPLPVVPGGWGMAARRRRDRRRRDRAARHRAAAARMHRRRPASARGARAHGVWFRRRRCCASSSTGPTSFPSRRAEQVA